MGSQACFGVLPARKSGNIALIRSMGSEKAMPTKVLDWIAVLMPMTFPSKSKSGPPELPWFMAALLWIMPVIVRPEKE